MSSFRLNFDGGLDAVSSKVNATPGTVYDTENFEVGLYKGYTRVDGFERYDGRISPSSLSSFSLWTEVFASLTISGSFTYGESLYWGPAGVTLANARGTGNFLFLQKDQAALVTLVMFNVRGDPPIQADVVYDASGNSIANTGTWDVQTSGSDAGPTRYIGSTPFANLSGVGFDTGETIWWPLGLIGDATGTATVIQQFLTDDDATYNLIFTNLTGILPQSGQVITSALGSEVAVDGDWELQTDAAGSQAYFNDLLALLSDVYRDNVTAVPGAVLTKIPGLFFFNDRTHALVDLVTYRFTEGLVVAPRTTPPLDGEVLQNASSTNLGTIVQVNLTSGTWVGEDAEGTIVFRPTGSITPQAASTALRIGGTEFATMVAEGNPERASIYYCDHDGDGGWNAVQLLRQIGYRQTSASTPSNFFRPYQRNGLTSTLTTITDTGVQAPAAAAVDPALAWFNPDNILLDDANYANSAADLGNPFTGNIIATFDLAALIPADSVITGIEINVKRYWDRTGGTGVMRDYHVQLIGITGASQDKAEPLVNWNGGVPGVGALETKTYGGSTDRWGNPLDTAEIRSSDFGVSISTQVANATLGENHNPFIGFVSATVYFQPQSQKVYIYNADATSPTDLEVLVQHRTIEAGSVNAKTAEGIIVVSGLGTDGGTAAKTRLIGQGEQIRTASGGGGSLIAITTSSDTPFTQPGSHLLAQAGTKYTSIVAAPYVGDDNDVVFFTNGVEYGCMFDGTNTIPLGTGLARNLERPRYVEFTGDQLALGYASGVVEISERGDPTLLGTATNDSSSNQLGDAITGLQRLPGEVLGIWTQRSIVGLNLQSLVQGSITHSSGGIDYTCVDMGQPVYADFRGIGSVQAVLEYGDFQRGKFSDAINPLLLARLQQDRATQTIDKRPNKAFAVRNKSQYVIPFNDGYLLRATFGIEGQPQFMWQRLYSSSTNLKILDVATGVTEGGRDVQFFTVDNVPSMQRYVYRFDYGRSYDGEAINSFLTLNPMHGGQPGAFKQWDQIYVYGQGFGYATVTRAVATTFAIATSSSVTSSYPFGSTTAPATSDPIPMGMQMTLSTNGRDISIRFAHSSASEGPFTLQAAEVTYIPQAMQKG